MEKSILVADDDRDLTHALALRLQQLGLRVMRSPDATHALLGVQRMRPDALILDVNMPGGSGLAVAEMLASDREFCDLPVIIHTGRDDELTRIRCTDRHHYYVRKSPDSWKQVLAIVCEELDIQNDASLADDPLAATLKLA